MSIRNLTRELKGLVVGEACRVAEGFRDVLSLEIRIRYQDRVSGLTSREQPKQARHGEAQVPDAGLAGAYVRADGDSRHGRIHVRL